MLRIRHFSTSLQNIPKFSTVIKSYITKSERTLFNNPIISRTQDTQTTWSSYRFLTHSTANHSEKLSSETPRIGEYDTLTEYHAYDMIHKLSDNDRASLSKALSKYDSEKIKSKFQGNFPVDTNLQKDYILI